MTTIQALYDTITAQASLSTCLIPFNATERTFDTLNGLSTTLCLMRTYVTHIQYIESILHICIFLITYSIN